MEKIQFDTLMLAITGLDAKLSTRMDRFDTKMDLFDTKMDRFETKMDQFETRMDQFETRMDQFEVKMEQFEVKMDRGFSDVRKDLEVIAAQTAKTVEDVTTLNKRIQRIPSA